MINKQLSDVLSGKEHNYLLPFYWQHGQHEADAHTANIPAQVERIYKSGCKALCVESRPHTDFCGDGWWRDMDIILSECRKRDMKVWILDDKHFPTGVANDTLLTKHPDKRQWTLIERHIDVMGPLRGASLLVEPEANDHKLIGVYAYRRREWEETLSGEPLMLTQNRKGDYLYWDIPDGCYRIFFYYYSLRGSVPEYISMVDKDSVRVLIDEVYEPHWAHYKQYFGNTIEGFFSDEPRFTNIFTGNYKQNKGIYGCSIGSAGMALPYNDTLLALMTKELGFDAFPYLGELWYIGEHSPALRLAYMNAATMLYRDCFSMQLGDWCRERGVKYIGHVIEDMNSHTHLSYNAGHFFRSMEGQDMSGIDIVLHQVMPGFANFIHTASCATNAMDTEFFHYVLAKLGASHAHQNPRMNGKAMCEVFGAYGWGEGSIMMKWLMDFLLVRGVNHFVPHAFSPDYPDPDCPPHFGAEGHDPQFEAFTKLMGYTNKASHLLCGARHIANAAILYHAEGEWMSDPDFMLLQKPAKALYDAHIDFDILSIDMLQHAKILDQKLYSGSEQFDLLIIPYAKHLPKAFCDLLKAFANAGLPVYFIDGLPVEADCGNAISLGELVPMMRQNGFTDLQFANGAANPLLRAYHCKREDADIVMLFNESYRDTAVDSLQVPGCSGKYNRLRLLEDGAWSGETVDGAVEIKLLPGQSEIFIFGAVDASLPQMPQWDDGEVIRPTFTVALAESDDLSTWNYFDTTDTLYNLNAPDKLPDFSGKIRYRGSFSLDTLPEAGIGLDLGQVAQYAKLKLNGVDCGMRICAPYRFDISGPVQAGENTLEIEVGNTLAQKVKDGFSYYLTLEPAGVLGDIRILHRINK